MQRKDALYQAAHLQVAQVPAKGQPGIKEGGGRVGAVQRRVGGHCAPERALGHGLLALACASGAGGDVYSSAKKRRYTRSKQALYGARELCALPRTACNNIGITILIVHCRNSHWRRPAFTSSCCVPHADAQQTRSQHGRRPSRQASQTLPVETQDPPLSSPAPSTSAQEFPQWCCFPCATLHVKACSQ